MRRLRRVLAPDGAPLLALDPDAGLRFALRPGEPPAALPDHVGLARVAGLGKLSGEAFWLEPWPEGARLSELGSLDEAELGMALLDVVEALEALHSAGRAHGALDAAHVVVDAGGRASLVGAGFVPGSAEADIEAFRRLMGELWPSGGSPPPDPGAEPAEVLAESLAGWLDYEHPGRSPFALGRRSRRAAPPATDELLPWSEESAGERVDEVGLDLGPDRGERGLLDRWTTSASGASESTGRADRTLPLGPDPERLPRRPALLARLIAGPERTPEPSRFGPAEGRPLASLKALIADEPLDPIVLPDGLPIWTPPLALELEPPPPPAPEEVSRRAVRWALALALLALSGVGLAAWLLL